MELSVIDKLGVIFKYLSSSIMTIELFILCLLFFIILILNVKRDNKICKIISTIVLSIAVLSVVIVFHDYAIKSIDGLLKWILNYIYFPSMAMYFIIIFITTLILIYSILSRQKTIFYKRVNIIVSGILYLLFISVISISLTEGILLTDTTTIYTNNTMVSFIQISDMIFAFWIEFIILYRLYKFFEKKYD